MVTRRLWRPAAADQPGEPEFGNPRLSTEPSALPCVDHWSLYSGHARSENYTRALVYPLPSCDNFRGLGGLLTAPSMLTSWIEFQMGFQAIVSGSIEGAIPSPPCRSRYDLVNNKRVEFTDREGCRKKGLGIFSWVFRV